MLINLFTSFPEMLYLQKSYTEADTYYIANHVDLDISYHSGEKEEWGSPFKGKGGRIICGF